MIGTTQTVLDWSRLYIPDPKTKTKSVRGEIIGNTSLATNQRETFTIKHSPIGSIFVYVDPYKYSATSSLSSASAGSKVFGWNATLQEVTFEKASGLAQRPAQFKKVIADYEYDENMPYTYSDLELADFAKTAVGYLNNTYSKSFTFTGTGNTLSISPDDSDSQELLAKAVAVIVRRNFVNEQKKRGLGIRFRGPLQSIDSVEQMRSYEQETKNLERQLETQADAERVAGSDSSGQTINVYSEDVVNT